jgi:hypothetical protein
MPTATIPTPLGQEAPELINEATKIKTEENMGG